MKFSIVLVLPLQSTSQAALRVYLSNPYATHIEIILSFLRFNFHVRNLEITCCPDFQLIENRRIKSIEIHYGNPYED